jgi:glycerophosphoryl diester phosphodiesterase
MDKKMKIKIVISSTLMAMLFTSHFALDKYSSSLNKRIISYGIEQESDINLVAHRGYSSMYPDNSLEALQACNGMECIEGIECDVRLTKDLKLVLMHNDYVGFQRVSDLTLEELRNIDLSYSLTNRQMLFKGYNFTEYQVLAKRYETLKEAPYTICTLEDILATRDKSKILFIDIKFSGYNDDYLIAKIGELLQGEENVIIQSFSDSKLRLMQELYPEFTYQLLIDSKRDLEGIDYIFDAYGIKYTALEEDTVEDLIDHDKKVSLWTIDSYQDFSTLHDEYKEYDEDIYYISDNPDIIAYQYVKKREG